MVGVTAARRRVRSLPGRAKAALVLAVVLIVAGAGVLAWSLAADDGDSARAATDTDLTLPSTTVNTGGIDVPVPEGWQAVPVPALRFGIAVPPGWEAVVLSPEGLSTLAGADPAVPGFVESAHAAAARGSVFYAAGVDAEDRVSDVEVGGAPQTGVTDLAGLEAYADGLARQAERSGAQVEVVDGAARPTVSLRFQLGAGDEVAEGTETLVLGPDGIVWSVIVTSDDAAIHDDLASSITDTLTLGAAG
jgi:hypothetical protein